MTYATMSRITYARLTENIADNIFDCKGRDDEFAMFMAMIDESIELPVDVHVAGESLTLVDFEPEASDHTLKAVCEKNGRKLTVDPKDVDWLTPLPGGLECLEAFLEWQRRYNEDL